ncbi:MAG: aminotransferase class IV [Bacteriovoracaceae bacterium]|nr:aminotransferase class IV [Bacteriovoracaceae bacterium]
MLIKNNTQIYFKGTLYSSNEQIPHFSSCFNRSILFGESIFTSMKTWRKKLIFLDDHLERLAKGIIYLWKADWKQYEQEIKDALISMNEQNICDGAENYFRVTFFQESPDGTLLNTNGDLNFYIIKKQLPQNSDRQSICIGQAAVSKAPRAYPPFLKVSNYVDSIVELKKAKESGLDDVFYVDSKQNVTEATTSNIFTRIDDTYYTPSVSPTVLDGITRRRLISALNRGKKNVVEKEINLHEFGRAHEIVLTNAVTGITAVHEIIGHNFHWQIQKDSPCKLREIFNDYLIETT